MPNNNLKDFDPKHAVELIRSELEKMRKTIQPVVLDLVYEKMNELVQAHVSNDVNIKAELSLFQKDIVQRWRTG